MKFRLLFVLLASLAILSGCGNSSDPVNVEPVEPVDYGPPAAPTGLTVENSEFDGSRWLHWTAVAAPDLGGYQVFQYDPEPSRETSYEMVGETAQRENYYLLPAIGVGGSITMRVRAVNRGGKEGPLSEPFVIVYEEFRYGDANERPSTTRDDP